MFFILEAIIKYNFIIMKLYLDKQLQSDLFIIYPFEKSIENLKSKRISIIKKSLIIFYEKKKKKKI